MRFRVSSTLSSEYKLPSYITLTLPVRAETTASRTPGSRKSASRTVLAQSAQSIPSATKPDCTRLALHPHIVHLHICVRGIAGLSREQLLHMLDERSGCGWLRKRQLSHAAESRAARYLAARHLT